MSSTRLSCRRGNSVENVQAEIAEVAAETHNRMLAINSR